MNKKVILSLAAVFIVSACGFEPLYVQKENHDGWYFGGKFDTSITQEMAEIKIQPIEGRFGQQIRNHLLDLLTPKGVPQNPKYRLYAELTSKTITQQALRRDITATSERVTYRVNYKLEEGKEVLVDGNSVAYVSYDLLANPYSTTMAQKKTEADAAKIIANDIALRLGAYFHMKYSNKGIADDFQSRSDR